MKLKFFRRFAITGFAIGVILGAYTFYHNLTNRGFIDETIYTVLCPPSAGAMALENAGIVGGIIGWLFISLINAGLYGLLGLMLDYMLAHKPE